MKPLDPKSGFARYASNYDELEKYWNSFEQGKLEPYIAMANGKKVLDAGAGTGRLSVRLARIGADVTAIDISPEMLEKLRNKNAKITLVESDVENMSFPNESFDMVFSSLTLVHLKKIEPFLDECYRVLKNDGLLVLVNVHFRKPMILSDDKGKYIIQCYNHFPRHVRQAAEDLAFGVEQETIITEGDDIWVSQVLVLKK
ncbi:MAG: class I SAM-dependent methyltransferase [Candidatus Peregrinibacteria bacterium]